MRNGARPRLVEGLLLRLPVEESVWLFEQRAESSGRDQAWSSAAVSGKERPILRPAD